MTKTIALLAVTASFCSASIAYNNTTTDQQDSAFFSTGFTQIGDQLQLVSDTLLNSVDAQFFNVGSDATFDAVLSFYNVGAPVGSQIGGSFTVSGIFIANSTSETVTFPDLGDLLVPQNVIVTLSVENVSAGGDIGVNFFDPPTVGISSNTFFIVNDGTSFSQASTNLDIDNIYMLVDGTSVPEPPTAGGAFAMLVLLALYKLQRA